MAASLPLTAMLIESLPLGSVSFTALSGPHGGHRREGDCECRVMTMTSGNEGHVIVTTNSVKLRV